MTTTSPFVLITRNPALDQAPVALTSTAAKVSSVLDNCFLCGCGPLTSLTTIGRRLYLKQVEAFKTYLTEREGLETCDNCLQEIKRVWDLLQEIEAIKEDISQIVDRVKASMPRNGGRSAGKIGKSSKGGRDLKNRSQVQPVQESSSTPIPKTKTVAASDSESKDASPSVRPRPGWKVEVKKEEVKKEEVSDEDVDVFVDYNDTQPINRGDGDLAHSDGKNIPQTESISSSGQISTGPKRKSRVVEDILRRTAETNHGRMPDDDSHSEDEGGLDKGKSLISEAEECSSDSKDEIEPEADGNNGPPRKKRRNKTTPKRCSSCSKKLGSKQTWAFHEAAICKVEGWTEERLKKFGVIIHPCPVQGCGKLFARPSKVTVHSVVHTGLKKFSCRKCKMKFTYKSSLVVHLRQQHGK